MKRAVLLLLAVLTAAMAFTPASIKSYVPIDLPQVDIMSALDTKDRLERTLADNNSAKSALTSARQTYQNAVAAFTSQRTIDIGYGDVHRIYLLLSSVQGISFRSLHQADPDANWAKGMELNVEDYAPTGELETPAIAPPAAVCMTLIVEDIGQGLAMIDKLALPVCQIVTTSPGTIEVTFLTGGGS